MKYLAAFALFQVQCQDTPLALKMMSVEQPLHRHPVAVGPLPELSIAMYGT
jgi:hypothetical protein